VWNPSLSRRLGFIHPAVGRTDVVDTIEKQGLQAPLASGHPSRARDVVSIRVNRRLCHKIALVISGTDPPHSGCAQFVLFS